MGPFSRDYGTAKASLLDEVLFQNFNTTIPPLTDND